MTKLSTEFENFPSILLEATPLLPTVTLSSPTALSVLSEMEKTNDMVEKNDYCYPDYHQNADIDGSTYYRVTLLVSLEQETAIIELFREKTWTYMKIDCEGDSSRYSIVQNDVHIPKDQEVYIKPSESEERPHPLFLEENNALSNGTDIHSSARIDCDSNSNDRVQTETTSSKEKQTKFIRDYLNAVITCNPAILDNVLKHEDRKRSNMKTRKRKGCDKDKLPSSTILNQNYECDDFDTERSEQKLCMETLTTTVKTENNYDCNDGVVKLEPESKDLDNADLSDVSYACEKRQSFKPRSQSPDLTGNVYCKECEHTFKKRVCYEKHLREGRCKKTCEFCGKEFLYKGAWRYMIHMRYHNKQKDQECKICGKMFIEKSKMIQHVKSHANPKPKICEKCGKGYPNTVSLNLHMSTMHVENRDMFQCSECAKMYTNKSSLQYHMRSAHDPSSFFACLTCDKTFKHKRLLKIHELTHNSTKDFKCDKCEATFKRASGLLSHQKRHEKAYSLFCRICNKGFYEKRKLQQHENIHTGSKPFKCSFCDYKCAFQGNLSKHMRIHRGNYVIPME